MHSRERLARGADSLDESPSPLRREAGLEEIVLLSTCSRLEIFARAEDPAAAAERLAAWFLRLGGPEIRDCLKPRFGVSAIEHIFRVAAGLESWILGESEILCQVKKAYNAALARRLTGPLTNRVFQSAIATGKLVRTQTRIQDGIRSIGGAAAVLARKIFGSECRGQAVVFGAGEAAEAVCRHLAAKNFAQLYVANRTLERAEELAGKIAGRGVSFEAGLRKMSEVEIALFSTSCARPLVEKAWLKETISSRSRPLFIIDLGMPRNVAPECAALPGVYLYDLDDLKGVVEQSMTNKESAKHEAEAIVRGAVDDCLAQIAKARGFAGAVR